MHVRCESPKYDSWLLTEEPNEGSSDGDQNAEKDKRSVFDARDHVWGDLTDNEIVHPVGRCSQCNTIWTS